MDKYFHPTHYNGCNCFFMLGLKLNHISKRATCENIGETSNSQETSHSYSTEKSRSMAKVKCNKYNYVTFTGELWGWFWNEYVIEKNMLEQIQRTYSDHTLSFPDCVQLPAGWGSLSRSQFVTIRQVQPSGYNYKCNQHLRRLPSRQDVSTESGYENISQYSTSHDLGAYLGYFTATLHCNDNSLHQV